MIKNSVWRIVLFAFFLIPLPAHAYWQQHVAYDIKTTLIDSIHTLDGTLSVVYANNSPDTLREVFFHLYANAFQPGSMMDERALDIHTAPVYDRIHKLPESEWGRYWIHSMNVDNQNASFDITGTIMRVALPKPLVPGTSTTISFPFREQIPRQIRRSGWMSREGVEYSMSQWYPKICEYDFQGWQKQEYISREFYGVWGDFNVEITLPTRFMVGATGECQNPSEVGHGYEQIASGTKQGIAFPTGIAGMTTWKFHASTVHDFAWVADDNFVHEWTTWNDSGNTNSSPVTVHAIYKSWVGKWWQGSALDYSIFALKTYSEAYGPYAYKNFSCTMAGDGGMEYPQLIMITGYRPSPLSLAGVIAHEIGHQWFYGMLGSNETREAFMDEGFTSYATTYCMNKLFGDHQEYPGEEHSWLDWFIPKFSNKRDNYRGYQQIASQGYEEPLDIPHDWFREDATAGQVYGKTQAILSMLQYTLGDSTFAAGMKNYYWQWRFKHPHLEDFKRVMEETAHTDLAWFFDEWFKTTRTVNYAGCNVSSTPAFPKRGTGVVDSFETTVTLHNDQLAVMPIDLLLHYDDGTTGAATIPLAVNQHLDYHKDGVNLFFPSWDWTARSYSATAITPKPVSWFEIDTSWRLQDLDWLNNYSCWVPPGEWALWKQLFLSPPINRYYAVVRPIIWGDDFSFWNAGAGIKFGMNNSFSGDLKVIYKSKPGGTWGVADDNGNEIDRHIKWYNYVDGAFNFSTPVNWLGRLSSFGIDAERMYGVQTVRLELTKTFRPTYWRLGGTQSATLFLEDQQWNDIDPYPVWHYGWGQRYEFDFSYPYGMHTQVGGVHFKSASESQNTQFDLLAETSIGGSDAQFSRAEAVFGQTITFERNFDLHVRGAVGAGTSGTPFQRQFWLARSNNYDEQMDGFYRAVSSISQSFSRNTSMFLDGGAGARGYNAGNAAESIYGDQMAGVSLDLNLPNPLSEIWGFSALTPGVFADGGWVQNDSIRMDAGIKITMNLLDLLPSQLRGVANEYDNITPITFDFPLWENRPLDGKKSVAFRWEVSMGVAL